MANELGRRQDEQESQDWIEALKAAQKVHHKPSTLHPTLNPTSYNLHPTPQTLDRSAKEGCSPSERESSLLTTDWSESTKSS